MSTQDRMQYLLELGSNSCAWCGYDLTKASARPTRDHLVPKIKGGPSRLENEIVACGSCNAGRGHASPSQFTQVCREERRVEPNVNLIVAQLAALAEAIEREGGMRKIRDYVSRELKRMRALSGSG